MQPFEFKATLLSLSLISAVTAAGAAGSVFSSSEQAAEKAYEQHQYKKAETSLLKALDAAATEGTKDLDVARARVLLAKVYRESAKPQKASEQMVLALTIYKKLGFAEPSFVEERNQLFKEYKQVDPGTLGQGYDALKNNSAVISIQKKDAGAHVEFTMPAPMEKTLNSPKVDGLKFEAVVSFDLATTSDGKVHASNIKGFKIHSVEKNTWANLLDLSVGGPANSEGTYDATIIAGKGGFTKTVAAKLPEKAYQPVRTIADQIEKFDGASTLDIPIASAPAEVVPTTATPTATPSTAVSPTVTTPTVTTVPTEVAPTASPAITPTVTAVPVDAPAASTTLTAPSWRETNPKTKKPLSSPAAEPVATTTPEVFSPKTEVTTSTSVSSPVTETTSTTTTTVTSPASAPSAQTIIETKVKSKRDDDDDDDDKEEAARKQRRHEERQARRAAEDAKEAAEDAAEKLDDAKKKEREREKERAKDKDKDDDDKNDKDRKDKD
ncbi:MAG: tetratricopeptide repeat protein [Cyanobacteria bacterium SZAS-4]|nr:tetratricopeptide repeat protein [Cyanobacteria bacterium SZAS-4]